MENTCRICGSTTKGGETTLHELMFRTGEEFVYFECAECGCMQIGEMPPRMELFYPDSYYAYAPPASSLRRNVRLFARALALDGPGWLFAGRAWWERGDLKSLRHARARRSDRILDLGCGRGELLNDLRQLGFTHLLGADPYFGADADQGSRITVLKQEASEVEGSFDLLMMHHSLEHVWDQRKIAGEIHRLLAPGGRCIIRIPTVDCWAWETFGADWIQLDPPRHFYLHSRRSIRRLLEAAGLEVVDIVDDSGAFQILGSEKAKRGLPLFEPGESNPDYAAVLPRELIAGAPSKALALNKAHRGDAIQVHARKAA